MSKKSEINKEKEKLEVLQKEIIRRRQKNIEVKKYSPFVLIFALIVSSLVYFFVPNFLVSVAVFSFIFILLFGYLLIKNKLKLLNDIKKMEDVFPDFISLMASNLRAGMTIDRALLLSSRKEFAPLDEQIVLLGKDIVTGKEMGRAMEDMAFRIGSKKITRTIKLVISGIKSGGNLAVLLEQTAASMRDRNFVEKRAASNVLMYVIFIFFAASGGGPVLFGLSTILVEIMTKLVGGLPKEGTSSIPFALTSVSISVDFIVYFCLIFVVVSNILASLVLGLVSKGKEREGLKYLIPMVFIGVCVFLVTRIFLSRYFSGISFGTG